MDVTSQEWINYKISLFEFLHFTKGLIRWLKQASKQVHVWDPKYRWFSSGNFCFVPLPSKFLYYLFLGQIEVHTQLFNTSCVVKREILFFLSLLPASSLHFRCIIVSICYSVYSVRIVNVAITHLFSVARPGAASAGRPSQQVCKFFPKCSNTNCHYLHPKVWHLLHQLCCPLFDSWNLVSEGAEESICIQGTRSNRRINGWNHIIGGVIVLAVY
jgi:hypothetical protein